MVPVLRVGETETLGLCWRIGILSSLVRKFRFVLILGMDRRQLDVGPWLSGRLKQSARR